MSLPIRLKEKIIVMDVLVIPSLPKLIILGYKFWCRMGVIPDLRSDSWSFLAVTDMIDIDGKLNGLTKKQSVLLERVTNKLFVDMSDKIGCTHLTEHKVVTNHPPIKQKYYPVSPMVQKHIDKELEHMLCEGITESSDSAWASPIILLKKKNGKPYCFCVHYRSLNKVTEKDVYPLPNITSILDKLREAKYLSTLDIKSAFWQIPMEKHSKKFTASTVPNRGLFQFCRLPFGLRNWPATWQRLIDRVIGNDLQPNVFVYLDDIVIVTSDFDRHKEILIEVFKRICNAGLTVSKEKCKICKNELRFLGYHIDRRGLHTDSEKVVSILNIKLSKNVTEVRRFLGMVGWYGRFIDKYSDLTAPITKLIR